MNTRNQPATMDGRISGHMMSFSDCSQLAPELSAASSREECTWLSEAEIVRTDMVRYLTM